MTHGQLVTRVRELMRISFQMRFQSGPHNKKVQAQAYADGYMRALLDSGQLDQRVLLRLIAEERSRLELKNSSDAGSVQSAFARPPA
jgi:hypothetical protein